MLKGTAMNTSRSLLLSLTLAATMAVSNAHALGLSGTPADYGAPAAASAPVAQRIVLTAATKSVNVNNGDTVEFVIDGKTFRWHFDTFNNETNFKLAKIAPAGVAVDGVIVYVGPNPTYRGY
jgi:hypothetical protein